MNVTEDKWLSDQIGKSCFKLLIDNKLNSINNIGFENFLNSKFSQFNTKPYFIYCKISTNDIKAISILQDKDFKLIDTNVSFRKNIIKKEFQCRHTIRLAEESDKFSIKKLAESVFSNSRFHLDPMIPNDVANKLKGEWLLNFFSGKRGNFLVVAEKDDNIVGFVLLLSSGGKLIIDLIGVDKSYRGLGIAGELVSYSENNLGDYQLIEVGTQISNVTSIKFYEGLGFTLFNSQYIFHYHNKL